MSTNATQAADHRAPVHGWLQTWSGKQFFPLEPRVEDIQFDDIAVSLSRTARFRGMTSEFYSVAQHCVLASRHVAAGFALAALLHDAHEAYTGDIPRPLKQLLNEASDGAVKRIERRLDAVICDAFGYPVKLLYRPEVEAIDEVLLATEKRDLLDSLGPEPWPWHPLPPPLPGSIEPWDCERALEEFYGRWEELTL